MNLELQCTYDDGKEEYRYNSAHIYIYAMCKDKLVSQTNLPASDTVFNSNITYW